MSQPDPTVSARPGSRFVIEGIKKGEFNGKIAVVCKTDKAVEGKLRIYLESDPSKTEYNIGVNHLKPPPSINSLAPPRPSSSNGNGSESNTAPPAADMFEPVREVPPVGTKLLLQGLSKEKYNGKECTVVGADKKKPIVEVDTRKGKVTLTVALKHLVGKKVESAPVTGSDSKVPKVGQIITKPGGYTVMTPTTTEADAARERLNEQRGEGAKRVLKDLGLSINDEQHERKQDTDADTDEDSESISDGDVPGGQAARRTSGMMHVPSSFQHRPLTTELKQLLDGASQDLLDVMDKADQVIFDVWGLDAKTKGRSMSFLAIYLFHKYDLYTHFHLDVQKVALFFRTVESRYKPNPYHNAVHGCDVLQETHAFVLHALRPYGMVTKVDILALLTAAAVHDLEHKGVTNDFLVATKDEWALEFNDQSPNEMHHLQAAFKLLNMPEMDFLTASNMSNQDRKYIRQVIIETVLATDMKRHFQVKKEFEEKIELSLAVEWQHSLKEHERAHGTSHHHHGHHKALSDNLWAQAQANAHSTPSESEAESMVKIRARVGKALSDETKLLIYKMCLKVSDIAHLAARQDVHLKWVKGLGEEFYLQGDREKAAGLPPSFLCDRDKPGVTESQVGFFEFVALPLFRSWIAVFPELKEALEGLNSNFEYWKSLSFGK